MPSTSLRASRLTAVAAASGATNWLNKATWKLFDGNTLSPLVQSGATSMGWLFDQTGTLRARPHNLIRNSSMQGIASGTPGVLPLRWVYVAGSSGISIQVVGTALVDGLVCADVRFFGTAAATTSFSLRFEESQGVAAVSGQTFTNSTWVAQVAGSQSGISATNLQFIENNSSGGFVTDGSTSFPLTTTLTRQSAQRVLSGANTAFLSPGVSVTVISGQEVNITLRIGGPQLNQGELQPYYPTTGAAFFGPRVSYDPAVLSIGPFLLAEEARTNSIRNSTMRGAVVGVIGAGGVISTNWGVTPNGLSTQIMGMPIVSGVQCIDVRFFGTLTSTSFALRFDANTTIAATNTQAWSESAFIAVVGGSFANTSSAFLNVNQYNSSGTFLASLPGGDIRSGLGSSLSRQVVSVTTNNASTAFVIPFFTVTANTGAAIDITLRIGLPQLEQAATASSPILTYGTAVTRSADALSVTNLGATEFNATEGTLYADFGQYEGSISKNFGILGISDGTFANGHHLFAGSGVSPVYNPRSGNTSSAYISAGGALLPTARNKIAASYSSAGFARAFNGSNPTLSAAAALPSGLTVLHIGRLSQVVGELQGSIYQAAIIPQRVSDSGLQRLTRI